MPQRDTADATAPAPPVSGLTTELAVGAIIIAALLLLAGLRIAFKGATVQIGG